MAKYALSGYALAVFVAIITTIILPVWSHEPVLLTDSQFKHVHLSAGQNFSITCYADSEAENHIGSLRWSEHNQTVVSEGNKILTRKLANRLTLTISNLTAADSGIYQCNALYKKDQVLKTEVNLVVSDGGSPRFEIIYENIVVTEFSTVKILCHASGTPPVNYTWYDKKETLVTEFTNSLIYASKTSNGSLLIIHNVQIWQSGLYMCAASNEYGMISKVYRVEVKEEILDIEDIMVMEVTNNSVTFVIPSQKKFDYIDVLYKEMNIYKDREKARWQQGEIFTIKDLIPSGEYTFDFVLTLPNTTTLKRSIIVPLYPAVPEVALMQLDKGNLMIRNILWRTDIRRGTIDMFQVSYELIYDRDEQFGRTNCVINTEIPVCHGQYYTIGGLLSGKFYEISIRAHTSAGFGESYIQKVLIS